MPSILNGPRERKPRISRLAASLWLVAVVTFIALVVVGVMKHV